MKKFIALILAFAFVFALSACNKEENEDILHLGLNAEIVEIDATNQIVFVVDYGDEKVFGVKCPIDCKKLIADKEIIYVDNETKEVSLIQFSDLAVGDKVTINAYESQLNGISDGIIQVEQILLSTQRLTND